MSLDILYNSAPDQLEAREGWAPNVGSGTPTPLVTQVAPAHYALALGTEFLICRSYG